MPTIRSATPADAGAILEIYAPFITGTCITFETEVPSIGEFAARIGSIAKSYPYLVSEMDGKIVGYAYASKHRERAAYRFSADVSVYVAPEYHRQGVGRALYTKLFDMLREQGIYTVFAGITLPNEKSAGLHKALGFIEVGVYHNVGYKLGKWLDVIWMGKALKEYDDPEIEFIVEKEPSAAAIEQISSVIMTYAGSYFSDNFADDVRTDAPYQRLCYLKNGEEIISGIMFTCLDGYPHITAMVTKRDYRGKGYGKRLMRHFVDYVTGLGFHGIELYAWSEKTKPVCASTQAFYKGTGFVVESEHMGLWAPNMITVKMKMSW
ncbi:MAG: GNAT family N-acetyltransferase [Defluviitaleaceae bacterium]|nr:GNAT family N-acetyltransferase [Defluviitaleaceae bacterium]